MKRITKHYRKLRAISELTAFGILAIAVLFVPSFVKYEPEGENVFDVYLNETYVGRTDRPEEMEDVLWQARAELAGQGEEMVFLKADLRLEGESVVFGTVDGRNAIGENMRGVLEQSRYETLQHAYTVKINDYTVNLRNSDEVLELLNTCLDQYDPNDEFTVELVVDPERELNVLTTSVCRTEEQAQQEGTAASAGVGAFFEEVLAAVEPAQPQDFESIDYGLVSLDFADTVEVVEAYLMEEELTPVEEAIDQVLKEQETEQIYEVSAGDTLSQIALDHSLTVEDLVSMNPGLEDENSTIRVGDELIITVPEPELSVIHEELVYAEENYNAPVEYVDVDEWYTTQQEVVQEPSEGHRKVASIITYRNDAEMMEEILLEEVDYEAVPRIIRRGTQVPPTYIRPISGGRLSSNFGGRNAPTRGASTNHQGIDWATPVGTAVMASSGGTVTRAGWGSGYGYVVYIQHADGRETRYGHLSRVLVNVGDHVDQGDKIALSGNTGRSTGPHLHFELRINGVAVNPLEYLE